MYEPPYVTYIQNLSDEDLVDIVKDLIGLRITGYLNKDSKFRSYVSVVKDFFKDFENPQSSPSSLAEKVVKDEVFKRFVELYDTEIEPLTFEQLKSMDGKPVWAEHRLRSCGLWGVVCSYNSYVKIYFPNNIFYYIGEYSYNIDYDFYVSPPRVNQPPKEKQHEM